MTIRYITLPSGDLASYDDELTTYHDAMRRAIERFPEMYGVVPEVEEPSAWRRVPDIGIAALKGAVGTAEAGVGLLNIPTGGAVGKGLESIGVRFDDTKKILDEAYSPQQQAANEALRSADGFLDTLVAAGQNPSAALAVIGESALPMLAGGVVGRGAQSIGAGMLTSAAIGEGVIGAGSMAESLRQLSPTGDLGLKQTGAAVGAGAVTGVLGRAGGALGRKFGLDDIDVAVMRGELPKLASKGFASRVIGGGITEGVFEEMPQSSQEQMWQNYATDKPIMDGVPEAAAMGVVTGGIMGAGVNVLRPAPAAPATPPPPAGLDALRPDTATPPSAALEAKAQLDELLAEGELTQEQYNEELARLAEVGLPPAAPVGLGALRPDTAAPPMPIPPAAPPPPSPVAIEQQRQQAAEVERQKQARAETLTRYGAATVAAPDGTPIGTRFGGKIYNHTGDPESNQQLVSAINKTIAADKSTPVREKVLAAAKETGYIPAGAATPAKVDSLVKELNLTEETPPATAVQFIESQLAALEGKTSEAAQVKRDYFNALLTQFGGQIKTVQAQPKQEVQDAVQERIATQEVPRAGTAGQAVTKGGEGVRPSVEGQVTVPSEAKEVALAPNALDTFSTTLPKGQKAVFDLVRQAAGNNELDKFVSPEGAWQATAMGEALGMSKQAAHKAVKDLRAKLDSAAGMDVKAALAARTAAVRSTEISDAERLGLSPAMQSQGLEATDVYGAEGTEPSMGTIETVGGSQGATSADVSGPLTAKARAVEQEARKIIREGGEPTAVESTGTSEVAATANQEQKVRDLAEAIRSGDLVDAVYEWNQQAGRLPGVTEIPTDFASMELSPEGIELLHAVVSAYQDVQLQIEAALDAGTRFTDPTGAYEYEFNRIVRERTAREAGAKRVADGKPDGAQPDLETKPEAGEGAGESGVSPKKPVKVEVRKKRVIDKTKLSETTRAENPISAESLTSRLKALFKAAPLFDKIVKIYATQEESNAEGVLSDAKWRVQGFKTADGRIGLIAENIEDGQELGVFLHEVGVHLGMEKLIGKANMVWLDKKVQEWAKKDDGSPESVAALAAIARSEASTTDDNAEGRIAYMVEELVKLGTKPKALDGKAEGWLYRVVGAMRAALLKLNLKWMGYSGQNLVDLAFGAAGIELGAIERPADAVVQPERQGELRLSEARTVAPDSPSKGVWEKAGAAFDRFFNDPMTVVKEHGLGWLSMDHLVEVAQGVNDKLVDYRDVSRKMQAMSKEWVYKAAKIDAEWGALSRDEVMTKRLSDVMRAATRAGFDPETGVAPANTDEHKVKNLYAELTPAAVKVYKVARDHYASARVERQRIAEGVLTAAHDSLIKSAKDSGDEVKLAKAEAKLKSQLEKLDEKYRQVKGPYFPLMRLGKWYVVGMSKELAELEAIDEPTKAEQIRMSWMRKSEEHYTTSSYETKSQATAAQKVLARTYAETRFNRAEEKSHAAGVLSAAGLQDVEGYINTSFEPEVASEIRTMMAELYYESLPEHHALKREMKREGVYGEEEDMRRVFAVSTIKSAHYMSRLKHADDLRSSLFAIRREGKKSSDAMEYYNEVVKRAKLSMDETSAPWADKAAAVSYLAHLGLNPAFVLTNASQVAMITAPWLAARTSVGKATAALGSAYRTAGDLIVSSYSDQGWRAELDWEGKVSKGVGDMLTTLLKRNLLDITIEHDLGATAELKHHALGDALKIGNLPVHITELANRAVTAIAAYNLAVNELKMSQAEAEEFASKAVSTTQLDYSALNAPRHMQRVFGSAPAARIVMQFRKYQQGMLWLIGRSIYNALKGASPEDKREARRTLYGLFTTTGVMAGSLGMPLAGTAMWGATMLASLFGDDDEPWEARTEYLNWLTEIVGKDAAIAIAKGVPAWLFGIDLEKRLGMGDIASPLPFMRQGKTAQEDAANALLAAAGAPVATAVDIWDGVSLMGQGDWVKGFEKVVPLKGVQNLSRGARYSMEGMTERDGDLILPPEAFSATDIGAKMAGFATTKESIYYEATAAVSKAKQAAQDVRKKLLAEIAQARIAGEPTDTSMKKIREFNSRHPEKGIRIDGSSIAKSVKARRQVARERGESGLLKNKQSKPFLKEASFAE